MQLLNKSLPQKKLSKFFKVLFYVKGGKTKFVFGKNEILMKTMRFFSTNKIKFTWTVFSFFFRADKSAFINDFICYPFLSRLISRFSIFPHFHIYPTLEILSQIKTKIVVWPSQRFKLQIK